MGNMQEKAEMVLYNCISGYHQYRLTEPVELRYVSQNLCDMVGYATSELLPNGSDPYAGIVYPEDYERFSAFLQTVVSCDDAEAEYRLVHKSGRIIHVHDTMRVCTDESGLRIGHSVLADVTRIRQENEELRALNETFSCGILKYTCDETPKVTYINGQMLKMLRFRESSPGSREQLEQYKQNIYLLIPPEERVKFRRFLTAAYENEKPIAGEINCLRCDGTRFRLYGWISKCVNADGQEEFQSVCMDVTERYDRKRREEEQSYVHALSQVYDEICELDLSRMTIRFLRGRYCDRLGSMAQMPMMMEDVVHHWIENDVLEEDREHISAAFDRLIRGGMQESDQPIRTEFRVRFSDQSLQYYVATFLWMGGSRCLFCCKNISHQKETDELRQENTSLRGLADQMKELVMRFTDGMLAFEIRGDSVRPMYISSNVCRFFGYKENEWLESMQSMTPIREFVSKCHFSYDDFLELLENREAEFHYEDVISGRMRRIKAICSSESDGRELSRYVMLYDVTDRGEAQQEGACQSRNEQRVYIRTFGYFDVFVDDTPIAFRNEKAKELFALLVDRRGGFVTSGEAISILWEDETVNAVTLARYRKVALRLKNTLEENGIAGIMESVDGKRRIVSKEVRCDLFEYLSGDPVHAQLFKGNYLQNYSWGETTLAELNEGKTI